MESPSIQYDPFGTISDLCSADQYLENMNHNNVNSRVAKKFFCLEYICCHLFLSINF